jgi:hypothetical protein
MGLFPISRIDVIFFQTTLILFDLFNDTVTLSDFVVLNGGVTGE